MWNPGDVILLKSSGEIFLILSIIGEYADLNGDKGNHYEVSVILPESGRGYCFPLGLNAGAHSDNYKTLARATNAENL